MDNPRPEKQAVVAEVRDKLAATSAALVAEYRGLKVKELQALRSSLAGHATVHVYKNTLVRFAARDLGLDALEPLLTGPTAIAFVDGDAAAAAKALRDFARTNPLLVLKGGLLGDSVVDAEGARALADLPSREVLLSQVAGLLASPLSNLAGLLDAVPRTFAYAVQALVDKGGAAGAPATEAPADGGADDTPPAAEAEAAPEAAAEPAADTTATDTPAEES